MKYFSTTAESINGLASLGLYRRSNIMLFSKVKDRILMKLINYNKNKKFLIDTLHVKYFDMAVVFYIIVKDDKILSPIIPIKKQYLRYWKITSKELFSYALMNTQQHFPSEIELFDEVMKRIRMAEALLSKASYENVMNSTPSYDYGKIKASKVSVYILTNLSKINGATCILYPGILKEFADKMMQDLIIIPSSVHEVLLLPAADDIEFNKIKAILREVNMQISEEEILSDTIYYYNRATDKLSIPSELR